MIMTVYGRFFKLYIYTAIAPVPFLICRGNNIVYGKIIFEVVCRSLYGRCGYCAVIALYFLHLRRTVRRVNTSITTVTMIWKYIGETICNMLVLVGLIKGADRIVKNYSEHKEDTIMSYKNNAIDDDPKGY